MHADRESKAVTIDDAVSLDPKSIITGGRRYAFNIEGQFILMKNLFSDEGRHEFVNNVRVLNHGPNVFLNGVATNTHENSGPHQRWSTGTLDDPLSVDDEFEAIDGGNAGTGHRWHGANMVFWNETAPRLRMQNPPTEHNWFIGATGDMVKEGEASQSLLKDDLLSELIPSDTYARIRLSADGGLGPGSLAADGEVEDYIVSIIPPPVVESVSVNNGRSQRSALKDVQVKFDRVVDIDIVT